LPDKLQKFCASSSFPWFGSVGGATQILGMGSACVPVARIVGRWRGLLIHSVWFAGWLGVGGDLSIYYLLGV